MLTWICISFRGSNDGDFCAVDVKKMEVSHWSKKVHLGSSVTSMDLWIYLDGLEHLLLYM